MKARPHALDVLLRLERRRLDEARAAVREADAGREAALERRDHGRARVAHERHVWDGDPALGPWLAAYLDAARTAASALDAEIDRLAEEHRQKVDHALQTRLECRRLELLAARAHERHRRTQARREERVLGELLPHLRAGPKGDR